MLSLLSRRGQGFSVSPDEIKFSLITSNIRRGKCVTALGHGMFTQFDFQGIFAAAAERSKVCVWNLTTKEKIFTYAQHTDPLSMIFGSESIEAIKLIGHSLLFSVKEDRRTTWHVRNLDTNVTTSPFNFDSKPHLIGDKFYTVESNTIQQWNLDGQRERVWPIAHGVENFYGWEDFLVAMTSHSMTIINKQDGTTKSVELGQGMAGLQCFPLNDSVHIATVNANGRVAAHFIDIANGEILETTSFDHDKSIVQAISKGSVIFLRDSDNRVLAVSRRGTEVKNLGPSVGLSIVGNLLVMSHANALSFYNVNSLEPIHNLPVDTGLSFRLNNDQIVCLDDTSVKLVELLKSEEEEELSPLQLPADDPVPDLSDFS